MQIGTPQVTSDGDAVKWKVAVSGVARLPQELWFKVPRAHGDMLARCADPALIALLIPAMQHSSSLEMDGPVTDELVHFIRHGYQQIMDRVIPGLKTIQIRASCEIPAPEGSLGVGTGFSAGIDSFAVIVDHFIHSVPRSLRLTHLTFFNVGSHGPGELGRRVFHNRFERLQPAAKALGLPFVAVDSNLDDFYPGQKFQQTNGPRNIAAAALLQEGIGRYIFASSFPYEHVRIHRSHDTAFSDPVSLPLLSTNSFRPLPHGEEYTRVQKTRMLTHCPVSRTALDVCVTPLTDGSNCSTCMKCMRTQLTLDMLGMLDDYAVAFNISAYNSLKDAYLDEVSISNDEFAREIREFAARAGYPMSGQVQARVREVARLVVRKQRGARRRARERFGMHHA